MKRNQALEMNDKTNPVLGLKMLQRSTEHLVQMTLVISNSLISNNRLSRSENPVPA